MKKRRKQIVTVPEQVKEALQREATNVAPDAGGIDWDRLASPVGDDYGADQIGTDSGMPFPTGRRLRKHDGSIEEVPRSEDDFIEVVPGIKFSKRLVAEATHGASDAVEAHIEQRRALGKARAAEAQADLVIARGIVQSLLDQHEERERAKANANEILGAAIAREVDDRLAFINVTAQPSKEAASRVLRYKDLHPGHDVVPIDLAGALDDVKPLREIHLDEVTHVMHVQRHQGVADLPARIQFAVPNVSLPAPAGTDPSDVTFQLHPYVQLGALPDELQAIIRTYISLSNGNCALDFGRLREQIEILKDAAEKAEYDAELTVLGNPTKWTKLAGVG